MSNGFLLADNLDIFDAVGICDPVYRWDNSTGGRSENQARDENNVPIWAIHISWLQTTQYGKETERSAIVEVAAPTKPELRRHKPIKFRGLVYQPSARLQNGRAVLQDKFTAESWSQGPSAPPQPVPGKQ